jgi:transcriptional regulator with XRE-family HTH domain
MQLMHETRGVSLYLTNDERGVLAERLTERMAELGRSAESLATLTGFSVSTLKGIIGGRRSVNRSIALRTVVGIAEFGLSLAMEQLIADLSIEVDPDIDLQAEIDHARQLVRARVADPQRVARAEASVRQTPPKRTSAAAAAVLSARRYRLEQALDERPAEVTAHLGLEQLLQVIGREQAEVILRRALNEALGAMR